MRQDRIFPCKSDWQGLRSWIVPWNEFEKWASVPEIRSVSQHPEPQVLRLRLAQKRPNFAQDDSSIDDSSIDDANFRDTITSGQG